MHQQAIKRDVAYARYVQRKRLAAEKVKLGAAIEIYAVLILEILRHKSVLIVTPSQIDAQQVVSAIQEVGFDKINIEINSQDLTDEEIGQRKQKYDLVVIKTNSGQYILTGIEIPAQAFPSAITKEGLQEKAVEMCM